MSGSLILAVCCTAFCHHCTHGRKLHASINLQLSHDVFSGSQELEDTYMTFNNVSDVTLGSERGLLFPVSEQSLGSRQKCLSPNATRERAATAQLLSVFILCHVWGPLVLFSSAPLAAIGY
jgi:hypothetical protein